MKNNIKTVTVGIPALNEELNIRPLLKSVVQQKGNFILEKIIVLSDGSTDHTPAIVRKMGKNNKKIILIHEEERSGKAYRLNQLFQMNTSDILVIFDADIFIPNNRVIDRIIDGFKTNSIVLVSGNSLPVQGENFWGKITQYSEELWYHARKSYNNGESYYNSSGSCFAIKKSFAKSFALDKESVHDYLYIYYEVAKSKKKFNFASDAVIYYKTPSNWEDIISHHARGKSSPFIEEKINALLKKREKIPINLRVYALLVMMKKNPFYTFLTLVYLQVMPLCPIKPDVLNEKGMWKIISSSKGYIQK